MCYEDWSQWPSVTSGGAEGDRLPAGEDVGTEIDSSDDEEENSKRLPADEDSLLLRVSLGGSEGIRHCSPRESGEP